MQVMSVIIMSDNVNPAEVGDPSIAYYRASPFLLFPLENVTRTTSGLWLYSPIS